MPSRRKPEPGGSVLRWKSVTDRSHPVMPQPEPRDGRRHRATVEARHRPGRRLAPRFSNETSKIEKPFFPFYIRILAQIYVIANFVIFKIILNVCVFGRRNDLDPWKVKDQVHLRSRTSPKCNHLVPLPTFHQNVIKIRS